MVWMLERKDDVGWVELRTVVEVDEEMGVS